VRNGLWRPNNDAPVGSGHVWPSAAQVWLEERVIPSKAVIFRAKLGYTYTRLPDLRIDAEFHEVKGHSAALLKRQWRQSRRPSQCVS
jgi:hypothetical protein